MIEMEIKYDFTIFIPSRARISSLEKLLDAINTSTANKKAIELIIALDKDDDILGYMNMINKFTELESKVVIRNRSWNIVGDYCNLMSRMSTAKILWGLNDDAIIGPKNWDETVRKVIAETDYPDPCKHIFMVKIGGTGVRKGPGGYSSFPMLSRAAFECLGYFFSPRLYTFDADEVLDNSFKPTGRIIEVMQVGVVHRDKICLGDETHKHMLEGYKDKGGISGKGFPFYSEIVNKLREGIEKEKK